MADLKITIECLRPEKLQKNSGPRTLVYTYSVKNDMREVRLIASNLVYTIYCQILM